MTRTPLALCLALCLVMLFAGRVAAEAQTAGAVKGQAQDDSQGRANGQPAQPDQNVAQVTLGQSAVPLYGPWKFTVGDSPIDPKTGKPLWAEPDFDDSKWETVDLTPKDGAFDPVAGLTGYVPGWTAKRHPGYWGYAWYRIRVQVLTQPGQARQGEGLPLAGPADLDDAYQVFDNGELAGHFGDFTGRKPEIYYAQPKMFPLPQPGGHGTGPGETEPGQTGQEQAGSARPNPRGSWPSGCGWSLTR
jgi:hypothetical protein